MGLWARAQTQGEMFSMAATRAQRTRQVRKTLTLSEEECARVYARMIEVHAPSFSAFAREALLNGVIASPELVEINAQVLRQLVGVATNLNQIARHVNIDHAASREQIRAAARLAEIAVAHATQLRRTQGATWRT